MIQSFDVAIIEFLARFHQVSPGFDHSLNIIRDSFLMKGGVIGGLLWWCWTRRGLGAPAEAGRAVKIVVAIVVSLAAGRFLQLELPFRARPLHDPALDVVRPWGLHDHFLDGWSSFPSDHAVLFFSLAVAAWSYDRRAGIFAVLWTVLIVCLPRAYAGVHYPSDLAAGGLIGAAIMVAALKTPLPHAAERGLGMLARRYPAWISACLFLVTFQVAELFHGVDDVIDWSQVLVAAAPQPVEVVE